MQAWHIRSAHPQDATGLAALAAATFRQTFTHYKPCDLEEHLAQYYRPEIFAKEVGDAANRYWVAQDQRKEMVAYAKCGPYKLPLSLAADNIIEIHRLYVDQTWHGRGIGQALMEKMLNLAARQRMQAVYLGVWEHNLRAQAFYTRHGFTKVGEYAYPPIGQVVDQEWIMAKNL